MGKVRVQFSATGTGMMNKLSVKSIILYESSDQTNWIKVKTYLSEDYVAMLAQGVSNHSGYVIFYGVAGRYYKAYVTFYATVDGRSNSRYSWTAVTRAT